MYFIYFKCLYIFYIKMYIIHQSMKKLSLDAMNVCSRVTDMTGRAKEYLYGVDCILYACVCVSVLSSLTASSLYLCFSIKSQFLVMLQN